MAATPESPRRPDRDPLDALLEGRPLRPSSDFAEKVLARIASERDTGDTALDALLASRPLSAPAGLADRVVAEVASLRRRRFVIFRVVPPVALAACLALAALPAFVTGGLGRAPSDRLAATLAADPELNALAALPAAKNNTLHAEDLAALADLGAGFAENASDTSYEI